MARNHKSHKPETWTLPVGAGEVISATTNQPVIVIKGLAVGPASLRVGTKTFGGIAVRGYDNTAGADGVVSDAAVERHCVVETSGEWRFAVTGAPKRGQKAFLVDEDTMSPDPAAGVDAGVFTEPIGTDWFVEIAGKRPGPTVPMTAHIADLSAAGILGVVAPADGVIFAGWALMDQASDGNALTMSVASGIALTFDLNLLVGAFQSVPATSYGHSVKMGEVITLSWNGGQALPAKGSVTWLIQG